MVERLVDRLQKRLVVRGGGGAAHAGTAACVGYEEWRQQFLKSRVKVLQYIFTVEKKITTV